MQTFAIVVAYGSQGGTNPYNTDPAGYFRTVVAGESYDACVGEARRRFFRNMPHGVIRWIDEDYA